MKQCSRCKKVKSRFDFYKDRTTLDGLRPSCIACRKESFEFITREFKFGERKYLLTEIKICSSCKKEKKREEFHRKTCAIDGLCESCKTCRKQQHQRLLEKRRDSNLQNTRKRRARKRDNGSTGFTKAHLVLLQEKQGATCPYCATYRQGQRPHRISLSRRASYHIDHVVPIAKGGTHDITNLILCCPECNLKKQAAAAPVPVQTLLPLQNLQPRRIS